VYHKLTVKINIEKISF